MTLKILSREDYEQVSATFKERSFMQSVEMADLLEKRGFDITFLGLEADGAIQVAGGLNLSLNLMILIKVLIVTESQMMMKDQD